MKKTLILMMVLGLISAANASLSFELRESDGTTPAWDLYIGNDYKLVVSSDSLTPTAGGIYGPDFASTDWNFLGPEDAPTTVLDTGNLSDIYWYATYHGYEFIYDDLMGPGISTGDIFVINLHCFYLEVGTFKLDLYDYSVSGYYTPIASISFSIVPEPITFGLLALGGLFLRRRK